MRQVNQTLIRLSGHAKDYIPTEAVLELGDDKDILIHGSVVEEKFVDNQDGTVDRILTIKGMWAEER